MGSVSALVFIRLLLVFQYVNAVNGSQIAPLSFPPSQYWDGNDGSWSTFFVQVGDPAQLVRVLPSSSGDALWVVVPQGCTPQDPPTCNQTRSIFNPNASSTWDPLGLYHLGLREESFLGYDPNYDNAEFGNETFTLGDQGSGLPTINNSVVEGIATKDFYMGTLGLTPHAINITNLTDPQPTPIQALKNASQIPSLSWGYTAGAFNENPPVFGSLTIGGYDTTRYIPNSVSFTFGADFSRDLLVGISAITTNTTSEPLLDSGIYAFIDSLVTEIWLPLQTCQAFEVAFGLAWDETAQLYLLNDTTHEALLAKNPNTTFQLAPSINSGSDLVAISIPYSAFDLNASAPLVSSTSRYFPLKRAQNSTQYTLGRTFLQYAYVITDYERSNFSVSQAQFPSTAVAQNIVAILPPGVSNVGEGGGGVLSGGAIAGIVVGIVALLASSALLVVVLVRRRRKRRAAFRAEPDSILQKPELDATAAVRLRPELDPDTGVHLKPELDAVLNENLEMEAKNKDPPELPGHISSFQRTSAHELLAEVPIHELPALSPTEAPE